MTALLPLLVIAALIFLLGGAVSLSNATMGVGSICVACLLAIFARMAQASAHRTEFMKALGAMSARAVASSTPDTLPPLPKDTARGEA